MSISNNVWLWFDKKNLDLHHKYCLSDFPDNCSGHLFYPGERCVTSGIVNFKSLANMNGTVNVTVPFRFKNFTYVGAHFDTVTTGSVCTL